VSTRLDGFAADRARQDGDDEVGGGDRRNRCRGSVAQSEDNARDQQGSRITAAQISQ
jgi:hypothetical protein